MAHSLYITNVMSEQWPTACSSPMSELCHGVDTYKSSKFAQFNYATIIFLSLPISHLLAFLQWLSPSLNCHCHEPASNTTKLVTSSAQVHFDRRHVPDMS
ncbi:hypothetical protein V5799_017358 [Amblyomma americanum]|uniref:Uncharacterized protein n=1 Tax=Amblyomma americanum TaxID=6943 RepID=A0AAQ4F3I8_AMBAM